MQGIRFSSLIEHFERELLAEKGDPLTFTVRFLNSNISHYNWVGIYMVEGSDLVLRTYSGPKATEHTRIKVGYGICGLAAKKGRNHNRSGRDKGRQVYFLLSGDKI
jgi:GAF domain-containing protein